MGIKADIRVDETRLRPNDVMLICGDNTRLKQELAWYPKYRLEQTIKDIVTYWMEK